MSEGEGLNEDRAVDETTGSDSSEEPSASEEAEAGSWISWFCSLRGNEFFCEVDEDYIQDDFNLSGLSAQVPYYEYALDLILDSDSLADEALTEAQQEMVETAAEALYGLIHARFIITARGLSAMSEKFKSCEFGRCPRVLCHGQPCLPAGLSDLPRASTVKLYCPRCADVYYPRSKYHGNLDGAYFGTTFPHLFVLSYPLLRPPRTVERYMPRVFGFKIHPSAWDAPEPAAGAQQQQQQKAGVAAAADKPGPAPANGQAAASAAAASQQQGGADAPATQQQQQAVADDGKEDSLPSSKGGRKAMATG